MLIQEVTPKNYESLTAFTYNAIDGAYKNYRTKRVSYIRFSLKELKNTVKNILKKNSLLKQEKEFLEFSLRLFEKKVITLKDFARLFELSFYSMLERLKMLKKNLTKKMKEKPDKATLSDREYYLSITNVLDQIYSVEQDLEEYTKNPQNYDYLQKKSLIIYKNILDLSLSIEKNDESSAKRILKTILDFEKIEFTTSEKLLA